MSKNNPTSRRQRKKEDTKNNILFTAIQFFQTQGYHGTTMEQVANAVDISKVTLYNYFPSKEAIVGEFFRRMSMDFVDLVLDVLEQHPTTPEKIYEMFRLLFEWNAQYRELLQVYFVHQFQSMLKPDEYQPSGLDIVLGRIIHYGQKTGEIRQDLPLKYLARHLEILYVMEFLVWLLEQDSWVPEKNLANMVDLFMQGAANHHNTNSIGKV